MENNMNFILPRTINEQEAVIGGEEVFYRPLDAAWLRFCTRSGIIFHGDIFSFCRDCEDYSKQAPPPLIPSSLPKLGVCYSAPGRRAPAKPPNEQASKSAVKRPPPWYVAFTDQFRTQLAGLDRKLLGRVLEKISELTINPTQILGDTIKPLDGNLKGFWRIRFGDYRMIYFPDKEHGNIAIYSLSPRGSAYD
jgi:mRNA-degrading endonuclease RelE of RelBE toxin-antitoxin system